MNRYKKAIEALRRAQWVLRKNKIKDELFTALCLDAGLVSELEQCNELIGILEKRGAKNES